MKRERSLLLKSREIRYFRDSIAEVATDKANVDIFLV